MGAVRVLLVGNYAPDAQESMQRYAALLHEGLREAGVHVTLVQPRAVLNSRNASPQGFRKWVGYVDKYLLSPAKLGEAADGAEIVHICDHANAVYVPLRRDIPHVVTCHDLLAVRGALGEDTDCPTSFAGQRLQRHILRGLRRAHALACVSRATLQDARRLLGAAAVRTELVPNALNYPYQQLDTETIRSRLACTSLTESTVFVLHVGSNLRRKNREAVLRSVAAARDWHGKLVFAGQPLSLELRSLADQLHLADRIVEVAKPTNALLEALYNSALALLFPSRFEGFGWPIIEAQACGCPVICGNREPLPEVSGGAAMLCDPDDWQALADAIVALATCSERRAELQRRGIANAGRYGKALMIEQMVSLYRLLVPAA
jgi:glycosyltransferase involved in cell wall biosynthesis